MEKVIKTEHIEETEFGEEPLDALSPEIVLLPC